MKPTKNANMTILKSDLKTLSDEDFTHKYPGIKKQSIENLSDHDLEKVVAGVGRTGGVGPTPINPNPIIPENPH